MVAIVLYLVHAVYSPKIWAEPPELSGDTAFAYLQELVTRGNRYYAAPTRPDQIRYMQKTLADLGWKVSVQSFEALETQSQNIYTLSNIIAIDPQPHTRRIILGSHWDTRLWAEEDHNVFRRNTPITGANDGSSGVALIFAIAEYLKNHPLSHTAVDIVLFDGEEFGRPGKGGYCKGSEYFVQSMESVYPFQPSAVIVLDMIADSQLMLEQELYSIRNSPQLWTAVTPHLKAQQIPFSSVPKPIQDDQFPFRARNIPAILLIDLSYPHWHTHKDTLDKCDPKSMQRVGNGVLSWLRANDVTISPPQ